MNDNKFIKVVQYSSSAAFFDDHSEPQKSCHVILGIKVVCYLARMGFGNTVLDSALQLRETVNKS